MSPIRANRLITSASAEGSTRPIRFPLPTNRGRREVKTMDRSPRGAGAVKKGPTDMTGRKEVCR